MAPSQSSEHGFIVQSLSSASTSQLMSFLGAVTVVVVLLCYTVLATRKPNIVSITPKSFLNLGEWKARQDFMRNARKIIEHGFSVVGENKPFRVVADVGDMVILPPSMAHEIRNDDRLSFVEFVGQQFHKSLPGFEPFEDIQDTIFSSAVRINLTQHIGRTIGPLLDESGRAVRDIFSDRAEWHELPLRSSLLSLIARMSSRVFLGEKICRNEAWLRITKQYVMDSVPAVERLNGYPMFLRQIVHWFLPECQRVRSHIATARSIIEPVIAERKALKAAMLESGKEEIEFNDAIEWFEQHARGQKYNPAVKQIALAIAAIHTTTDLLTQTLFQLLQHPEMIQKCREEMIRVFANEPIQKTSLYKLRLLDSVLKESQRLKPAFILSMTRVAMKDTCLPDGTHIPKGTKLGVSLHNMLTSPRYKDPLTWDGERFLRMRENEGEENAWQLATTSPDHLAFGHGMHACPGRFMAASETKIALCHLLLKYDLELEPGVVPRVIAAGPALHADPTAKVRLRRRQPEVELRHEWEE